MHRSADTVRAHWGTNIRLITPGESLTTDRDPTMRPALATTIIPAAHTLDHPRQLASLDMALLDSETATAPMHIGGITVLDSAGSPRGPLDLMTLRRLFADRLHLVSALRRRVRTVPLGLDLPYWEDCASIDLGYHVRETRLPDGANDQHLAEYVARRHAQPLDRVRPLWECHLISGLSGGRQAIYTKLHHAIIDGVSAAEIMAAILDIAPCPVPTTRSTTGMRRGRTPSALEMLARSVPNALTRQATRLRAAIQTTPALVHARDDLRAKHPSAPFKGPGSSDRSVAFTSLPLDAVKEIKKSIDGTVNDVVMTLCTAALRRWMLDHDFPTDRPLLAAIPVSVRTPEQIGTAGNQFSLMLSRLPISETDPHHRLKVLHNNLLAAKGQFQEQPATLLHWATSLLTPLFHGLPTRTFLRAAAPALPLVDLLVSNVPGPQMPLYLSGIRIVASYPVSVLTELSGSLNITVMSYDGRLDFGIVACPDAVPDIWDIARHLSNALTELQA